MNFFDKYVISPIEYLLSGMPTKYSDFVRNRAEIIKIADCLIEGRDCLATVNGVLYRFSKDENGRIIMKEVLL